MTKCSFIKVSFKSTFFKKFKLVKRLQTVVKSSTVLLDTINKFKKLANMFCILNVFQIFFKENNKIITQNSYLGQIDMFSNSNSLFTTKKEL